MGKFADICGNEAARKALTSMVDSGRIPHALMMHENDGCSALSLALAFFQYACCPNHIDGDSCGECPSCRQISRLAHPDLHFSFPITTGTKVKGKASELVCDQFAEYWRELYLKNPYFLESDMNEALGFEKKRGQILVAEGNAILRKLSLSAVSGRYRAMVIYLPELINQQTANKLLKAIEEPAEGTMFILVTHSPENVLQTISSRCQPMRILPLSADEMVSELTLRHGFLQDDATDAAAVSGGSIGLALREYAGREEVISMRQSIQDLFEAAAGGRLQEILTLTEQVAAMESREKQKLFCTFAAETLRNIFMMQNGMDSLCTCPATDREAISSLASQLPPQFCRMATASLERASSMIDRNVSQKIIFAALALRLYQSIQKP